MKKAIIVVICTLVLLGSTAVYAQPGPQATRHTLLQPSASPPKSTTLISEAWNHRVIEVDINGTILWQKTDLNMPADADRLPNGHTLISIVGDGRVIEVDKNGAIVWNYSGLYGPFEAERLANGNTLITDTYSGSVVEVNASGGVVWRIKDLDYTADAERLINGNTLITLAGFSDVGKVIEVNTTGAIQWQYNGTGFLLSGTRLTSGNTLITEFSNNRVIEVNPGGTIVWEKTGLLGPARAERLRNGNTLIAQAGNNLVTEVSPNGSVVWELTGLNYPIDATRLYYEPVFNVTITKGLGITTTVKNVGTADASNVTVTLKTTGLVLWGKTKTKPLVDLPIGATDTAKFLLIGLGKVVISVTVTCAEGSKGYGNATGFLLLVYVF